MQELKQKQLTSIMNFKLNMKLLVFVAIFVFYVISKTDGLRCYHCYDGHNTCDIQTETACHLPTDAEFCYTRFFPSDNRYLNCDKEYCMHRDCNDVYRMEEYTCNSAGIHVLTIDNQTHGLHCCNGDLCNKFNVSELLKLSLSAQSLSQNSLF